MKLCLGGGGGRIGVCVIFRERERRQRKYICIHKRGGVDCLGTRVDRNGNESR